MGDFLGFFDLFCFLFGFVLDCSLGVFINLFLLCNLLSLVPVETGALMANFSCPYSWLISPVRGSASPCVLSGHQQYIHMKFSVLHSIAEFRRQFESKQLYGYAPCEPL